MTGKPSAESVVINNFTLIFSCHIFLVEKYLSSTPCLETSNVNDIETKVEHSFDLGFIFDID